jgi:signal-transduction protein with cAMP-binding, CBS, and nucleotidyltransferase domain
MKELAKHCHYLRYERGSEIHVRVNDKYFYLVEKGRVTVEGEGKCLEIIEKGIFGGRDIFGLETRVEKVKVEEDTTVYRVPEPLLETILKDISEELKEASINELI